MHFLYVFTLQFLYNSTRFERPFRSSSGVHKLTVSAVLYKLGLKIGTGYSCKTEQLDTFARFEQSCRYSKFVNP